MDFELTPEQELIRRTAREFCDAEIAPHATDWDRAEAVDPAIVAKLAEVGFLGAALPEEHGGMGLDMRTYALVVEELGRADSNIRGIVSVSNGLYGKSVARFGSPEQRERLLPPLAAGTELGCYALTEPGAGSDPGGLETRAEPDGDGWRISGQKIFITLGSWAEHALVFARTGEAELLQQLDEILMRRDGRGRRLSVEREADGARPGQRITPPPAARPARRAVRGRPPRA